MTYLTEDQIKQYQNGRKFEDILVDYYQNRKRPSRASGAIGRIHWELFTRLNGELRELPLSVEEIRHHHIEEGYARDELIKDYDWSSCYINPERVINFALGDDYDPYSEKCMARKNEKIRTTTKRRHGVDNYSELKTSWDTLNKIPYSKLQLRDEIIEYSKQVDKVTKKNLKKIEPPDYCYYTGIRFIDAEQDQVNPNDPRKRTVDHRVPRIICFMNGISVEDCAQLSNLVFCLRLVNNIKGNTDETSFLPIAHNIRKRLVDEGCQSN